MIVVRFERLKPVLTDEGFQRLVKLLRENDGCVVVPLSELLKLVRHV